MNLIYLSLGSNLGNRVQYMEEALTLLQDRIGPVQKLSRYYESKPWGFSSENRFCNCCVSFLTSLEPLPLMDKLLEIEYQMGRRREGGAYRDRIIDIDLLFYGERTLDHPRLTLPHPSLGDRRFVLHPLQEIAPELLHPVTGISIIKMLEGCTDQSEVVPLNAR